MDLLLEGLLRATLALFVIVDPFGNIPILMGLTSGMTVKERMRTVRVAMLVSLILLNLFALAGQSILQVFNVSLGSFKIAGGILLFIISIKILLYGEWEIRSSKGGSIGVVPLAFPLIVGPGAITLTIVHLQTYGVLVSLLSVLIVIVMTWLVFRFVEPIYRLLGEVGSNVIARLMAVFIAAIAIELVVSGISQQIPSR